ncbi:hypothetical protein ACN42_g4988 [Penicillium freii]|uniref:Uncharacterized protein n=1 Tax=Penicillium freii TaxID=48697 RepID=A0A101MKB3_PENFR|nr:hypothetical protein ACN42_g4988 [Penicillium freii]
MALIFAYRETGETEINKPRTKPFVALHRPRVFIYYSLSLLIFSVEDVYKTNLKSHLFTHGYTRDSSSMFMEQTSTQ